MKQKTKTKSYIGPLILTGLILAALVIVFINLNEIHSNTEAYNDRLNTQLVLLLVFLMVFGFSAAGIWAMIINNKPARPMPLPAEPYSRKGKLLAVLAVILSCGALAVSAYDYFTGYDIAVAVICALAADVILSICAIIDRLKKHKVTAPQILCTLLIAGSVAAVAGYELYTDNLLKPLNDHIAEYLALQKNDPTRDEEYKPGIGKAVAINLTSTPSVFKAVHLAIPEKYRAATPEEVKTVILLSPSVGQVGTYTNGAIAEDYYCYIQVYDADTGRCLLTYRLSGGSPPDKIQAYGSGKGGSVTGNRLPNKKIIEYVNHMLESQLMPR